MARSARRSTRSWRPTRSRPRRHRSPRRRTRPAAGGAPISPRAAGGGQDPVARHRRTSPTSAACSSISRHERGRPRGGRATSRARRAPEARGPIAGVTVQPMVRRPKARELIAGIADDPTFGPVVVFGRGGTAVEVIDDKALALPPLDLGLARDLIAPHARLAPAARPIGTCRPPTSEAVALVLVKLAQLAADLPEIRELDINPLLADESGVIARRCARGRAPVGEPRGAAAIRASRSGPIRRSGSGRSRSARAALFVRPVRPEDEGCSVTSSSGVGGGPAPAFLRAGARFQPRLSRPPDADRLRARDRLRGDRRRDGEMLGAVRLHADANHESGRIRHPDALGPQGPRARLGADAPR